MDADTSHFSMVGFGLSMVSESAFEESAQEFLQVCTPAKISDVDVVCLVSDRSGAELRFALRRNGSGDGQLVAANPAFRGTGRTDVEIVSDVSDPGFAPFETTLTARFAHEQTPLVIDLADPLEAARLAPWVKTSLEITGFSFEPKLYKDEAAFADVQHASGAKVTFAANYFVPSGMFAESAGGAIKGDGRPVAYADFAGKILKTEMRNNGVGGGSFWWVLVQSYDNWTFDVVIDPRTTRESPTPGMIITGRFWLSGRIIGPSG